MLSSSLRFVLIGAVAAGAVAPLGALSGCAKRQPAVASTIEKHTYTVRAQIVTLPEPGSPTGELQVRHEAMPHFRAGGGELGMNTMIMPFPLAEGLSLSGLSVGQKIDLTFEVDFDTAKDALAGYRATKIEPLPDSTELDWTPLPGRGAEKKPGDQTN
jgi:hypothetical protein